MRDKPTLSNLQFMADEAAPTLTREQRIAALLREDAEVKSQIARLTSKRADLKELLKEIGEDAFERWYFQEHGEDMAELRRKEAKRQERRAAIEDRKRRGEERRANMTPEALAKLKASIAELKESTPEELKADHAAAVAQRKQSDPRRWRRNGKGDHAP
jgi:chromosome segregation ATPase